MKENLGKKSEQLRSEIASHPLFSDLRKSHLKQVLDLGRRVTFPANKVIFREGRAATAFFLLLRGDVALETQMPGSEKAIVQILHPGDALGWSWIVPPYVWHFDGRTLEKVEAIRFNAPKLRALCEDKPRLGRALYRRIAEIMLIRLQSSRLQNLSSYHNED